MRFISVETNARSYIEGLMNVETFKLAMEFNLPCYVDGEEVSINWSDEYTRWGALVQDNSVIHYNNFLSRILADFDCPRVETLRGCKLYKLIQESV